MNRFLVIAFLTILVSPSFSQKTREQLEQEKKVNLQRIQEAQKILKQTEKKRINTLGQLNAINHQIEVRQDLIRAMQEEITLIDQDLEETEILIGSLEEDLKNLKEEYAAMVYSAHKANAGHSTLLFIFSSESFNQFFRRLKYLDQYSEARKNQIHEINMVKEVLTMEIENLQVMKSDKNDVLNQQIKERQNLQALKTKQQSVISSLSNKEQELRNEIAAKTKANERLANEIDRIIAEELARRERERVGTADVARLSTNFERNKASLIWPVASGFISKKYGKQPHPVFKKLQYVNNGVDIQTQANESVKAVFDGKVSAIVPIPGMNNAVLVRHGDYITVYANLEKIHVKIGQEIKASDIIGEVHTNREGLSELHFEIWKNKTHLNPVQWLAQR